MDFEYLSNFGCFGKILKSRGQIQDGSYFDIMMSLSCDVTSSYHLTYIKREIFGHTIVPISFIVMA